MVILRYPFSLICTAMLWWLSLGAVPQSEELPRFEGIDKVVHFVIYFGLSATFWWEYLKKHPLPVRRHLVLFAIVLPFAMGIALEIAQAWLTTYRSGDALDALFNALGIIAAAALGRFVLLPLYPEPQ